ncbi:MAG: NADPH-dependent FMN reductase [Lutibacter sp.]|nr:MAG: NADPH-dependent FMN reductase [Lutibacter sp.]
MKNIVTIGGSTSKNSINKVLAEYAGSLLKNVNLTKVDLNNFEMPLFSVDIESDQGYSKGAIELNQLFEKADGFVISLAEHNGAYSAAFKNTYDWLSRIEGNVWRNKPMLLLSTSPGVMGGKFVMEIATNKFPRMGANIVGSMSIPSFYDNFKDGNIVNVELKGELLKRIEELENSL